MSPRNSDITNSVKRPRTSRPYIIVIYVSRPANLSELIKKVVYHLKQLPCKGIPVIPRCRVSLLIWRHPFRLTLYIRCTNARACVSAWLGAARVSRGRCL